VSVVVPTKNEARNIARFLDSVPPGPEVLLCDASDDGTPEAALAARPLGTRVIRAEGTIAAARQLGAEASRGDILVFADADVTFAPRYFSRLFLRPAWHALYGVKLSGDGQFARHYQMVAASQRFASGVAGIAGASGSNMAIRRSAFAQLGGFRADLPCNEDSELFFRAHRLGLNVRFRRDLVVYAHDHRRLERGAWRKALHSLTRNALVFASCLRPRTPRLLRGDWGYWRQPA
jgi:glycosyltransferase involved in cell wall biosynthesis